MKIVIVGDGKMGFALTERLSKDGHDVVVIDRNARLLEECQQSFDVMAVQGNGASMEVLMEAGVESADLLIAVTNSDEINILCCMMANKLGHVHTIARVRSPEYVSQLGFLKDEMGLSMTINPEYATAREIYHLLQVPSFLKRDRFAKGRVEIVEIKVSKGSPLLGKPLSTLSELCKAGVLVCAVERENEAYIPSGGFVLEEEDNIYVTADSRDLSILIKDLDLMREKIKQVMIVGGSRSAFYLAQRLLASGVGVKIIEQDPVKCVELSTALPRAMVIEADGSRQDILLEEGIDKTDAVVTLTNIDEENLIMAMYAVKRKVPKVIAKINRTEYIETFQNLGVDTFINPKTLCSSDIVRYVRAMENTSGGSVKALHYIVGGKAEALEFVATESTRHRGESLAKIKLREGILIACIMRQGKIIIPSGSDHMEQDDIVIVVTTAQTAIKDLNDIFA